ncbi:hypothetical protein KHS38_00095 [Mucilaginibacter sp. Bleaf8]|uniref:Ig-like domain-containing protein n=1 Tax=Mucilaginibacter sp. Bleaf8 TaxID=2834430 RepID=UPI001BCF131D|nr:hypothetical protein [Mucilaginibacter sp. Bleaf8]MBS7562789.1 hypothetical protein [Mucilaginibacter sp. Bleaf8]
MKQKFTLIKLAIVAFLSAFSLLAAAQSQTPTAASPFYTPSDATSAPPNAATDVGKVLCFGGTVTLKGNDAVVANNTYQWFKVNTSGQKVLVKEAIGDNTYQENTQGAGYYTYHLVVSNADGCSSPESSPLKVYVLPQLNATIAATKDRVCSGAQTTSDLSIQGLDSRFEYTYQWTRDGQNITNNGTSSTYTVAEQNQGTVNYAVKIAYKLNPDCTQTTAPKAITVVLVPGAPTINFGN